MIDDIVKWHKETFPDADLKSQKIKFLEEYKEYLESGDIMELADMIIVNEVLTHRFHFSHFSNVVFSEAFCNELNSDIFNVVEEKMKINKQRTWHKVNGVYRHEDV